MTAANSNLGDRDGARRIAFRAPGEAIGHVDRACYTAIGGRRASRALAEWAKRFGLTEAELQLLWRLRTAPPEGLDQTALAAALAFSPAQISASVERLRVHGLIAAHGANRDRRRHHWQLSPAGRALLDKMLDAVALLRYQPGEESDAGINGGNSREAAA